VKFDRLRIVGFKTFVDPTELVIEPGLTGVVGPNGCGKSNLVEALRWVMGETSHKSMRASGMDDVIFSGSGNRPARNHAEVVLRVDNHDRDAPAAFNDAEHLEISRKIEREQGSTYRINGREVRARDVQLLFADAASGARSPSMVRQGQISEIISAKPQARRRVLEDAAGVAGLHARRHDAELKLKAAEDNLARVVDVLTHIDGQIDSLRRQVRQAERYKVIAAELRQAEAVAHQLAWHHANVAASSAERQLDLDTRAVAEAMAAQGQSERERAVAQHAIEPLRAEEMKASEALQRLVIARETLDGEEKRAKARIEDIDRRLTELRRDEERASRLAEDAEASLARLAEENAALAAEETDSAAEQASRARLADAERTVGEAEQQVQALQVQLAEASAARSAAERAVAEATARLARARTLYADAERQQAQLLAGQPAAADLDRLKAAAGDAANAAEAAESEAQALDRQLREARDAELKLRPVLQEADRAAQRLETEARTIRKLFDTGAADLWPRVIDAISVAKGYEVALGAAFGEDLEASTEASAPVHWAGSAGDGDAALPAGAEAMARHVKAPAELARRLAHIGIVAKEDGPRLAKLLKPGQRLVSRAGDLWRWDGFVSAAEAPSAAARRLAEKNRLGEIEASAAEAAAKRDAVRAEVEAVMARVKTVTNAEFEAREKARAARRTVDSTREAAAATERRAAEFAARERSVAEALARLAADIADIDAARIAAEAALAAAADVGDLPQRTAEARAIAAEKRSEAAQARAALEGLVRERDMRQRRREAIAREIEGWTQRKAQSAHQTSEIADRLAEAARERNNLDGVPAELMARRRALTGEIEAAEAARKTAGDRRAEGETLLATFDRVAREAMQALAQTRENRARTEAQLEAARERLTTLAHDIEEATGLAPAALAEATGIANIAEMPAIERSESRLADLKRERERIGAVNLRAEEELAEVETNKANLTREHEELSEAIRRLRRGIESLNAEGRNRLIAAFEVVNNHFKSLFSRLFGGGTAELQLIESDDPLEAGLEIMAHPPGKKPQVLTLLSGGEQALTATALIFAVFLTNPSPVCVLDEVDAPLDDSNVERLCDLLIDMAKETATRFVMITHNPISMARMDRLFGVTMADRGVSQLVSVDLEAAERLAEAS
jgi:chromosome segregation protein